MKSAPAIGFTFRTSYLLLVTLVLVAMLAAVAVWLSGAPYWLRMAVELLVAVSVAHAAMRQLRPRIRSVSWRTDGGAELGLRSSSQTDGGVLLGTVHAARVLGPLIVLTLRWPPRERAHLWLLPDNLDADTRRRLRMRLGAGGLASGNADSG